MDAATIRDICQINHNCSSEIRQASILRKNFWGVNIRGKYRIFSGQGSGSYNEEDSIVKLQINTLSLKHLITTYKTLDLNSIKRSSKLAPKVITVPWIIF